MVNDGVWTHVFVDFICQNIQKRTAVSKNRPNATADVIVVEATSTTKNSSWLYESDVALFRWFEDQTMTYNQFRFLDFWGIIT